MDEEAALTLALGGGFGPCSLPTRQLRDNDHHQQASEAQPKPSEFHPQASDILDITLPFDPSTGWPGYVPPNVVKAWGSDRPAWLPTEDHLYYVVPGGIHQHRSLPYPNGQYQCHVGPNGSMDYSDPRFFRPTKEEEKTVLRMLGATLADFRRLTKTKMKGSDNPWLNLGYAAAHSWIVRRFEEWVRDHREISEEFREQGQVKTDVLYKLERWYGLLEHWQHAPNCKV